MKLKNKLARFLCLSFALIIILTVFVGAETSTMYMENIGIIYTDAGQVSLSEVASDDNIRGQGGVMTVTMSFYLYTSGYNNTDWFTEGYQLVKAGALDKYDLLSIGYPNRLLYDTIEAETERVYFNRYTAGDYMEPLYIPEDPYWGLTTDRDYYNFRHKITITYRQDASFPSVQNISYHNGIAYAMQGDYVYSGSEKNAFNMLMQSKYCEDLEQWDEFFFEPIEITVKPGTPKSVSYSGDENETVVYTVCTYFDIYNLWFKFLYEEENQDLPSGITDAVYKYSLDIDLRNSYNVITSSENDRYVGGMGLYAPYNNFDYYESLSEPGAYDFNYLKANKTVFTPARNTEYWLDSVTFKNLYTNNNLQPATRHVFLTGWFIPYSEDFSDNDFYGNPFYYMRPYVGVWTSHDITTSYDVTYDGSNAGGIDTSRMYVPISFNMPEWGGVDEAHPVKSFVVALGQMFEGLLRALIEVSVSVIYNAFVWICTESPFLSDLISPIFQVGTLCGKLLFDYFVPFFGSVGVFACVLAVPLLVSVFVR